MRPLYKTLLGAALAVAGALVALLYTGVYFIADCSADCVARGERTVVVLLILGGLAVAVGGVVLARSGLRRRAR